LRIVSSTPSASPRCRRAASVVEFALLAPVFGVIIIGMFELGHAYMVKQVLSDAAQKGCRTGTLPGKGNSDILTDVSAILTANNVPYSSNYVTISVLSQSGTSKSVDASAASAGDQISVQISIPVSKVSWTSFFLGSSNLESETIVMLKQGIAPYTPYTP
jgi:Flp pilus assembly protein TadG